MKQLAVAMFGLLMLLSTGRISVAQDKTFTGEIADEHLNCVQNPMKASDGITQKDACVLYWAHFVQPPSKYVLYNAATKTTYQLDDQSLVQPYVGAKAVVITGTLDAASKTIHVTGIRTPEDRPKS